MTYLAQIIRIIKPPPTRFTIVPIMPLFTHMPIRSTLTAKHIIASLALDARCPMARRVHMLVRRVLAPKLAVASLAVKGRRPVVEVVHVLGAGAIRSESSRAGLAFGPVVVVVHVVVAVALVPEFIVAGCAVVHRGWMMGGVGGWSWA